VAARSWSNINRDLDRFVKGEMRRTSVPGAAVGILYKGRRFTNGYGVTNVNHPLPVTADTLFQIGSTTKTFTATAIMRLVEEGKLDLDTRVRRYLPELRLRDEEAARKVTLRHLLTHMGGWVGDYFVNAGWGDDALQQVVSKMARVKQLTPLGTVWSYSNSGFYIAGRVIEKVTKQTFEQAIKEMLFDQLEMSDSHFFATDVMLHRFAVGHITNGKKSTVASPWRGSRGGAPAGGIASTAPDQLRWAEFHMGDGRSPGGKRLLKKSTLQLMQKEQVHVGSMTESIGISWMLNNVGGVKLVRHGGTTNGQLSAFLMVPERQFAVTVLTNSTRGRELHPSVVRWALTNYLGITDERPAPARVDPAALAKYAGKYRIEATGQIIEVTAGTRRLVLQFPQPEPADTRSAPRVPPIPVQFYASDRFIGSAGPYAGLRGDFLRGPAGRITWLRFGGRLYRRLSETVAARALARSKS
jgi:CubicO group peptidase (beta-lactamase class C family)